MSILGNFDAALSTENKPMDADPNAIDLVFSYLLQVEEGWPTSRGKDHGPIILLFSWSHVIVWENSGEYL